MMANIRVLAKTTKPAQMCLTDLYGQHVTCYGAVNSLSAPDELPLYWTD